MSKRIDLTGQKFERLKVIECAGKDKHGKLLWKCECKCGNTKIILGNSLRAGKTKSCGCLNKECGKKLARKYNGERKYKNNNCHSRLYNIWHGMKQRCKNTNNGAYKDYGGRGIEICVEWDISFETFEKWAIDNGYNDDLTLDRKDNSKGYSPENCRWVTRKRQSNNTRNNHMLQYKGEEKTLTEWAEIVGINADVIKHRIYSNWPIEKALETPVKK